MDASALYARNLFKFVELLVNRQTGAVALDWNDEIIKATVLTHGGRIVHPAFADADPAAPPSSAAPVSA
jgi:NAD(P) transhydrogenase subunit alpha